ncbi:trimeric intracellular cation channel family protein [Clostridium sp. Marseille-P299]|uniref:trimeric intracellular cation channel family protein n=1 Tax=Clostridium sp. Marseille-P299 TaxID=1805477 RepID=UPI00082ABFF6|nr:trimeric intracellular cation channel family protein [Clostridium sp. Marseille-P299]
MNQTDYLVYIIEIIGTIAFASSGALLAMEKHMDIFGVCILGITTAVGGGIIRDVVLGNTPPNVFRDSSYVIVSIIVSTLLFILMYMKNRLNLLIFDKVKLFYNKAMMWMDAIGLGIFTVVGINTAITKGYEEHIFLLIFVGMVTGIGGGMLRDVMALRTPFVFVKHVYASASLVGAIAYIWLINYVPTAVGMAIAASIVVAIRVAAAHYKWNLPKI